MIRDIFSIFDPARFSFLTPTSTFLIFINALLVASVQLNLWKSPMRKTNLLSPVTQFIMSQLFRTVSLHLKGISSIVINLFILLILINLVGIVPYCPSSTRHLIMTLSIGLPAWIRMLISRFIYSPKKSTAHFLPDGAPEWLNPFLVLIETTRVLVRPITLSFRLAANMTAGHIVLTLVRIYAARAFFTSSSSFIILLTLRSGYIAFELAICLIQAYIFCLLLSLYSDDHAH